MAENVLQIEIQDKGAPAPSDAAAPPRAPAAEAGQPLPRSAPASTGGTGPTIQPVPAGKVQQPQESIVDLIADRLGFGRQLRAIQSFLNLFTSSAPRAPLQPIAPPSPPATPPRAVQAPAAPLPSATQPVYAPMESPGSIVAELQTGFKRVGDILQPVADYFTDLPDPATAPPSSQKAATAPIAPPRTTPAHGPASRELRHNPDLDAAMGAASKPQPPRVPTPPPMPAAAREAARAPLAAPTRAAAGAEAAGAGEAAVGAEAAGAGMGAVGAAALPLAIGFGMVTVVLKVAEGSLKGLSAAADGAGVQLSSLAKNDFGGALRSTLDTSAKAAAKIPIIGGFLAAGLTTAASGIKAFSSTLAAFDQRASELAAFSPAIMMAEQRSAMRSLFDDIREAQELGPGLARMLDAETKLQHDMREIFLPIKKIVVDFLADVLKNVDASLPEIGKGIAALLKALEIVIEILDGLSFHALHKVAEPMQVLLLTVAKRLEHIQKNTEKERDFGDMFLQDLLQNRDWNFNAGDPWRDVEDGHRPRVPIVAAFAGL